MIEIASSLFGLIQGVLIMLNKRSNWIFYTLQMFFLTLFSIEVRLWGDVFIDVIYAILGVICFILWKKGNSIDIISTYGWKQRIICGLATIISIIVLGGILNQTNNPLPFWDSATSVTSIVATWLMFCRKLETWIMWFVNDILYLITYLKLPDPPLYIIMLYIIWTILAVISFVNWKILYSKNCIQKNDVS
ncbi:MAG: nicotinamide mononucleotide transporter [Muribaculaceae bacterium]|nr:nicotinamide mononucleotide transporter [Muribaculaceae bacterium]